MCPRLRPRIWWSLTLRIAVEASRVDQVLDSRLVADQRVHVLLERAIGLRQTPMLTQVLRPRTDYERLDIPIRDLGIVIEPPSRGAIATPDVFVLLHRVHECAGVLSLDEVLNGDEHRTIFERNLKVLDDGRHTPM